MTPSNCESLKVLDKTIFADRISELREYTDGVVRLCDWLNALPDTFVLRVTGARTVVGAYGAFTGPLVVTLGTRLVENLTPRVPEKVRRHFIEIAGLIDTYYPVYRVEIGFGRQFSPELIALPPEIGANTKVALHDQPLLEVHCYLSDRTPELNLGAGPRLLSAK